jgi:hypothetical protein
MAPRNLQARWVILIISNQMTFSPRPHADASALRSYLGASAIHSIFKNTMKR